MPENEMSLAVFDPMKAINADIIAKDAVQEFDYATPEGIERVRSWCHRLRGHKGDIERCRIASKEGAAKYVKQVNQIAKDLTEEVQTIHDVRMKPIKDIEAANRAEAEVIVAAEEKVKAEKAAAEQKELEEFRAKAQAQQEKEAAEKAEKEQAEREKQIAIDAAAKATKDAEEAANRAEDAARDAALQAIREKNEAIDTEREKARKELQRIKDEADKIASDLVVEQERIAKESLNRVADVKHRKQIEEEVHDRLDAIIGDPIITNAVMVYLVKGEIPNVTINY